MLGVGTDVLGGQGLSICVSGDLKGPIFGNKAKTVPMIPTFRPNATLRLKTAQEPYLLWPSRTPYQAFESPQVSSNSDYKALKRDTLEGLYLNPKTLEYESLEP